MNVAIVSPSLDISWGGQRQVLELAHALIRQWDSVSIFCDFANTDVCHPWLIRGLEILTLWSKHRIGLLPDDALMTKLSKFFLNILYSLKDSVLLSRLIRRHHAKSPYDVFNFHDDSIYLSLFLPRNWVWMMNDLPWILDAGVKWYDRAKSILAKLYATICRLILTRAVLKCSSIVVLDNANFKLSNDFFWVKTFVVRSWIDQSSFPVSIAPKKYKGGQPISFLSASIFFPHRRYEDAILAFSYLKSKWYKDFIYRIIGRQDTDIAYFDKIRQLVLVEWLEDNVVFLGWVSESELRKYYSDSDVFIFPNAPQTWWLAVFESMLSGCAAIVTDWCWAHEVLTNWEDCLMAKKHNPLDLASKIELFMNDPSLVNSISINWHAFVKKNLSWDKYADSMRSIFLKSIWK